MSLSISDLIENNNIESVTIEHIKKTKEYLSALKNLYNGCIDNIYAQRHAKQLLRYVWRERRLRKYNGYHLKFYFVEKQLFREEYDIKVTDKEAVKICKKLARHFKFYISKIRFYGYKRGFVNAYGIIRLPHNPSIGIICHECAHLLEYEKYHNFRHNKKLLNIMKRFINYCRKKNYWRKKQNENL